MFTEDGRCTMLGGRGLEVEVVDAASGERVVDEVEVVARDGTFSEILGGGWGLFYGVEDRLGTYAVTAAGGGYEARTDSVTVGVRECDGVEYARETEARIALTRTAP